MTKEEYNAIIEFFEKLSDSEELISSDSTRCEDEKQTSTLG